MRRWWLRLGAVALFFSVTFFRFEGCDTVDDAYLQPFESCEELEAYIEDLAVEEYTYVDRDYPSVPSPLFLFFGCADAAMDYGDDDDMALGEESGGGNAHSTTNTQEFGVDESDFVKNDGDFIYAINGFELAIVSVWPADDMHEASRVELAGYPVSMFLMEDSLAVLSYMEGAEVEGTTAGFAGEVTKVSVFDVTDRYNPVLEREVFVEGRLKDSRRVDHRLYLVTYRDLADTDLADEDLAKKEIKERVAERTLDDWLPRRGVRRADAVARDGQADGAGDALDEGPICNCTHVYRPARDGGLGMVSVLAVDLSDPDSEVSGTSVIAGEGQIYASLDSLYLAVEEPRYGAFAVGATDQGTRIHKFDLEGGPQHPVYEASGRVPGAILNQFSMDEGSDGTFRIATSRWDRNTRDQLNGVYVLEQDGEALTTVGTVDDIAPGEDIYAVRFFDDVGYVVTFQQIDPLFTIDLTDRQNPAVLGELDVPGYSTYLHPFGEDHLLSIGEDMRESGEFHGLAISLFDVSDLSAPDLAARHVIPTTWDSSEALYDHHAFNYYEPHDMLAIPLTRTNDVYGDVIFSGLLVFDVTVEKGIRKVGEIDASPLVSQGFDPYYAHYCNQIRRSVVIEDTLYGVAAGGIIAAPVEHPNDTVALLAFPTHGNCDDPWSWEDDSREDAVWE